LAWAGHPGQARNRLRSVPLARLSELTAHFAGRCDFHVLQKGEGLAELDGLDAPLLRSSDGCEDFADTAALIGQLDLVITVDTSVAHLAGGLGHPCWILLAHVPDWRYGPAGEQCGWYPQARLFRQETDGDWQGVLERVRRALEDWLVQA
ncbi:MAG: glycosyltransferase, partial [Leptothrix sp. (in: b-proteobacteria)]